MIDVILDCNKEFFSKVTDIFVTLSFNLIIYREFLILSYHCWWNTLEIAYLTLIFRLLYNIQYFYRKLLDQNVELITFDWVTMRIIEYHDLSEIMWYFGQETSQTISSTKYNEVKYWDLAQLKQKKLCITENSCVRLWDCHF